MSLSSTQPADPSSVLGPTRQRRAQLPQLTSAHEPGHTRTLLLKTRNIKKKVYTSHNGFLMYILPLWNPVKPQESDLRGRDRKGRNPDRTLRRGPSSAFPRKRSCSPQPQFSQQLPRDCACHVASPGFSGFSGACGLSASAVSAKCLMT